LFTSSTRAPEDDGVSTNTGWCTAGYYPHQPFHGVSRDQTPDPCPPPKCWDPLSSRRVGTELSATIRVGELRRLPRPCLRAPCLKCENAHMQPHSRRGFRAGCSRLRVGARRQTKSDIEIFRRQVDTQEGALPNAPLERRFHAITSLSRARASGHAGKRTGQ